jgi:AraC family transcriptional activator of pobA
MPGQRRRDALSDLVRAGRLVPGLRPRVLGLAERPAGPVWACLLIESGAARLDRGGKPLGLEGPALVALPWPDTGRLRADPGTSGIWLFAALPVLRAALGPGGEAEGLDALLDETTTLGAEDPSRADIEGALASILAELHGAARAAPLALEGHLRLLVIHLSRSAAALPRRDGTQQSLFARFETQLERHFRDRWTVRRHAAALGISRDRLGDICRRHAGRTPRALIEARIAREARLMLTITQRPVEQIAASLGFSSAANFNRFYRRVTGQTPGRERRGIRAAAETAPTLARLHDWP